jgi:hypothetical protein
MNPMGRRTLQEIQHPNRRTVHLVDNTFKAVPGCVEGAGVLQRPAIQWSLSVVPRGFDALTALL